MERHDQVDLYPPPQAGRRPAVVVAHGIPLPPDAPDPREWLLYQGYAALLAEQGAVTALARLTVDSPAGLPEPAAQLSKAVDLVRADPRVDPDRVALWFFSGSGLLLGDWLREPPPWLRGVAATYPLLAPLPGWAVESRFHPIEALAEAENAPPLVLTRAGLDRPEVTAATEAFTAEAARLGMPVQVIDVPDGRHGFDALDHTDRSRAAVRAARDAVLALLTTP
ncbi:alpha/beta hydrolase family protein [Micromonospora sp. MS34]|uniref:alpha/beta hydrolase family protein n=1 Tax=Micromonospora sp. MS34 TaxID=3385971 RepID=UPI0039A3DDD5